MTAIDIDNIRKTFGNVTAVDIPELKIEKGDLVGLVGNNGAGKTTLLRLLLDLSRPDEGTATLHGVNPRLSEEWKAWTGAFIDDGFLIDFLSPKEYFDFIARIDGIAAGELSERIEQLHGLTGDELLSTPTLIRNLSAGNRQKVGIAAALINNPRIVILDEPFNFLDPSSQEALKRLLTDYNRTTGATIIVSSHNLQLVTDISTRLLVMDHGSIVKDIINDSPSAAEELRDYFAG